MKNIITAIGNEMLNESLKKEKNINIIGKDIQYKEGILETLEQYKDINIIIINEKLNGEISLKDLINKIKIINKYLIIIIFIQKENIELENELKKYDVKIVRGNLFDKEELLEIINNEENKKIEENLKEEIDNLKKIILDKQNKKNFIINIINNLKKINLNKFKKNTKKNKQKIINNNFKKNTKIICVTGPNGVGKSIITINLGKSNRYLKNKTLIMDLDLYNKSIHKILGINLNSNKFNKENIIKINKKLHLIYLKNKSELKTNDKSISIDIYKIEINKIINNLKNNYNNILIDLNCNYYDDLNKFIMNLSDYILFISDTNFLEINKSIKLLDKYINNYKINKNKFKIIFNKYNENSIDLKLLKKIFNEFKIIGSLKYNNKYNKLINKNNKNNFLSKKIRKEYLNINKNLELK